MSQASLISSLEMWVSTTYRPFGLEPELHSKTRKHSTHIQLHWTTTGPFQVLTHILEKCSKDKAQNRLTFLHEHIWWGNIWWFLSILGSYKRWIDAGTKHFEISRLNAHNFYFKMCTKYDWLYHIIYFFIPKCSYSNLKSKCGRTHTTLQMGTSW